MSNQNKNEPTQLDRVEAMLILLCEQLLEDEADLSITLDDPIDDDLDNLNTTLD